MKLTVSIDTANRVTVGGPNGAADGPMVGALYQYLGPVLRRVTPRLVGEHGEVTPEALEAELRPLSSVMRAVGFDGFEVVRGEEHVPGGELTDADAAEGLRRLADLLAE